MVSTDKDLAIAQGYAIEALIQRANAAEERLRAIEEKLFPPPSVLDDESLRVDVFSNMAGWSLRVLHVPSTFVEQRTSEDWKSQLRAKADAYEHMEKRVRAWLDQSSPKP